MKARAALVTLAVVAAACGSPSSGGGDVDTSTTTSTATSTTADPVTTTTSAVTTTTTEPHGDPMMLADFMSALEAAGADVGSADPFTDHILGSDSTDVLCVDGQSLQIYVFGTLAEASAAADLIDRDDPSHIGNSIVEWIGPPTFWQAGTMIVQYIGKDELVRGLVTSILDQPISQSHHAREMLVPNTC